MEWLATASAHCSRGLSFARSGPSHCAGSPFSVSGPAVHRPIADVLRCIGVGVTFVHGRGLAEHAVLRSIFLVSVLARVAGDGRVARVDHDQVDSGGLGTGNGGIPP